MYALSSTCRQRLLLVWLLSVWSLALGGFLQFTRKLFDPLTHDFPRLELDGRARGNHKTAAWLIGVSAHSRFGQPGLENAKVAQLHGDIPGQTISDLVKRSLDYIEDLMLNHPCLITDGDYDIAFG